VRISADLPDRERTQPLQLLIEILFGVVLGVVLVPILGCRTSVTLAAIRSAPRRVVTVTLNVTARAVELSPDVQDCTRTPVL
jgi:hypothetical protein